MKDFANIFWFLLGGFIVVAIWGALGLIFCATVVGKEQGKDLLRCAKFAIAPFGKAPQSSSSKNPIIDLCWIATFGIILLLLFLFMGLFYTITIIGIPFGKQCFKMVVLAMGPFNVDFEEEESNDDHFPRREEY